MSKCSLINVTENDLHDLARKVVHAFGGAGLPRISLQAVKVDGPSMSRHILRLLYNLKSPSSRSAMLILCTQL